MGLVFGIFVILVSAASMSAPKTVKDNSVLEIALDYTPPEQTNNVQVSPFGMNTGDIIGMQDILKQIARAKEDDRIKGIYLDPTFMSVSSVSATSLANALDDFRSDGKFVLSYANFFGQGGYYLASAADTIMMNPIGGIDFRGFASMVPFFKDVLDATGIKMQIYYAGKFKSATEPYRRNDMSPENKLQTRQYLEEVYGMFLADIAERRNLSVERLRDIADNLRSADAKDALALGLVDHVGYADEADAWMRRRLDLKKDAKISRIAISDYFKGDKPSASGTRDKIAVVTCEGTIVHNTEEYGVISDAHYVDVLQKLRLNKTVKAVVLNVNSPGGNILAAENILREVQLIQEAGKPVVVSMGNYAASGGYYISCTADSIFAAPNTLTGSIGVFSIIPNPHELLNEKIGIHFDTVRTARHSASFTPFFEWSEEEHGFFKKRTDDFYTLFLEKVAAGRGMTVDEVNEIAQGRIWTGNKALEIGLIDRVGGLEDAITAAASLAELETYRISQYPRLQDPWNRLITELTKNSAEASVDRYVETKLRDRIPHYDAVRDLISAREPVMHLPVIIEY